MYGKKLPCDYFSLLYRIANTSAIVKKLPTKQKRKYEDR